MYPRGVRDRSRCSEIAGIAITANGGEGEVGHQDGRMRRGGGPFNN